MTCIVGLEHDGMVSIGGDTAGVNGWLDIRSRSDEKVFINGSMIFGFTSSFRMGQLLRYSLTIPEQLPSCKDDYQYMCTSFIDAVRQCLKTGGYAQVKDGIDSGGTFLVGYRGKLYRISNDFQVGRSMGDFDACGAGETYAMGAMWNGSLEPSVDATEVPHAIERIRRALACASNFSAAVSPPFFVLSSDGKRLEFPG